jgi:hypothetical protein
MVRTCIIAWFCFSLCSLQVPGWMCSAAWLLCDDVYRLIDGWAGQCGVAPCRTLPIPHEVTLPRGVGRPVRVACGTHYTLVAFDSGQLVAFGRNSNGELVRRLLRFG